jgi:pimeloyl-ACP methyl ester carboxylesterase
MPTSLVEVEPGVRVNVQDIGSGPPVVLVHGWSLSHEVWDRQIRVLAEAGHRVVAMDVRGHGGSDAPLAGYGMERLAADVVAVMEHFDLRDVALVGWSLGGMTALRVAATAPDRLAKVVMVASNGVASARHEAFPFGAPAEQAAKMLLAGELGDRVTFRTSAIGQPFGDPPSDDVLRWLLRISLQTPSWAGAACMRTLVLTEQVELLDRVTVPVDQIIGTRDPAMSRRGAPWVQERLGGTLVELDCGHYPMLERADEFDAALLAAVDVQARVAGD